MDHQPQPGDVWRTTAGRAVRIIRFDPLGTNPNQVLVQLASGRDRSQFVASCCDLTFKVEGPRPPE